MYHYSIAARFRKAARRILHLSNIAAEGDTNMIYVTGDTHGDLSRFKKGKLFWMGKKNTLIILGDFGFLWNCDPQEMAAIRWLAHRRYKILFLDGCHENFEKLAHFPEVEIYGAKARHLGGNLYYVQRGQILMIEDKKLLCFGGGQSHDRYERVEGENWWPEEMPTAEEMEACTRLLSEHGNRVDYILTHDAPTRLMDFAGVPEEDLNELNDYFDKLLSTVQYRKWLFGRYHRDINVSPKARCVFLDVVPLND